MRVVFTEVSGSDLGAMEITLRRFFIKHVEKISGELPRRHMRFGVPFFVEEVTRQARLVYEVKMGTIYIIRCFALHKEYEKWYKSFK
ncbi:MAG: hypothetical protein AABX01_03490 [Candidatus Micrarchaeota archaeon]